MFRPRIIRYILIAVAVYLGLIGLMFVFSRAWPKPSSRLASSMPVPTGDGVFVS